MEGKTSLLDISSGELAVRQVFWSQEGRAECVKNRNWTYQFSR